MPSNSYILSHLDINHADLPFSDIHVKAKNIQTFFPGANDAVRREGDLLVRCRCAAHRAIASSRSLLLHLSRDVGVGSVSPRAG